MLVVRDRIWLKLGLRLEEVDLGWRLAGILRMGELLIHMCYLLRGLALLIIARGVLLWHLAMHLGGLIDGLRIEGLGVVNGRVEIGGRRGLAEIRLLAICAL